MRVKGEAWSNAEFTGAGHEDYSKTPRSYRRIYKALPEGELRVLLAVTFICQGFNTPETDKQMVAIDCHSIAQETGLQDRSIWRALDGLAQKGIIIKETYRLSTGQSAIRVRLAQANDRKPPRGQIQAAARTNPSRLTGPRAVPLLSKYPNKEEGSAPLFEERSDDSQGSSSISPNFDLSTAFESHVRNHPWLNIQLEWEKYCTSCFGKGRVPSKSGMYSWVNYEIERRGKGRAVAELAEPAKGSRRFEDIYGAITEKTDE